MRNLLKRVSDKLNAFRRSARRREVMQEEIVAEKEISLMDILRALIVKWKILLLVLLVGCVGGVAIGFVKTYGVHYYGTNLEFYVTPTKPSGTVSGESTNAVYGAYGKNVMDNIIKLLSSESFAESLIQQTEEEGGLPDSYKVEKYDADGTISTAYANLLKKVKMSVSFSYLLASEATSNTSDLARSFIYVEISVLGDENEQFAIDLLKCVKSEVPEYVESNMMVPSGYDGTSCSSITVLDEIHLTNENYAMTTMFKFAAIMGLAAIVVACVIVVIVDRSDKRLRDYELISRKFNIPVLGVIPTIEGMTKFTYARQDNQQTEEQK